ncbi:MAG: RsfA family transcriptional regulator [Bacillaceae bacterium]|nr:RsfA family transcriptional regulator [Bacillaceae bacterium]
MAKVRQDAWSHEDDLLLAETVLRHIREGSTQLKAFEEVGDKLNRTAAACGFRWNAEVRKRYEKAIDLAKRQRKEKKRAMAEQQKVKRDTQFESPVSSRRVKSEEPAAGSFSSLDQVIEFLREFKKDYETSYHSQHKVEELEKENETLQIEKEKLEKKLSKLEKEYQMMQEDYQVLMEIMDRARKMVVLDDQEQMSIKSFRMDKNGNLEKVAR